MRVQQPDWSQSSGSSSSAAAQSNPREHHAHQQSSSHSHAHHHHHHHQSHHPRHQHQNRVHHHLPNPNYQLRPHTQDRLPASYHSQYQQQHQTRDMANNVALLQEQHIFRPGTLVEVLTVHDEKVVGEVLAFEFPARLLIIKSPKTEEQTSNPALNSKHTDVTCFNLDMCRNVQIISEGKEEPEFDDDLGKLPHLDTKKLNDRLEEAMSERNFIISSVRSGIDQSGIFLYRGLQKTLPQSLAWQGESIIVSGKVLVAPPYGANSISLLDPNDTNPKSNESLKYIKDLVIKYWQNQDKDPFNVKPANAAANSTAPTTQPQPAAASSPAPAATPSTPVTQIKSGSPSPQQHGTPQPHPPPSAQSPKNAQPAPPHAQPPPQQPAHHNKPGGGPKNAQPQQQRAHYGAGHEDGHHGGGRGGHASRNSSTSSTTTGATSGTSSASSSYASLASAAIDAENKKNNSAPPSQPSPPQPQPATNIQNNIPAPAAARG